MFAVLFGVVLFVSRARAESPLVEIVDKTAFIQLEADPFFKLSLREKALAYWLNQAAIAIEPIAYDQISPFGLLQKRLLEAVVSNKDKVDSSVYSRITDFTKLFWANKGNHNQITGRKFLPKFTPGELKLALERSGKDDLLADVDALAPSLFDPEFEPLLTSKASITGKDRFQASANNLYVGVTLAELIGFHENYPLNSRVVKKNERIFEEVYRTGTPDGKIPPGLYASYLKKANQALEKALAYAEPAQAKAIADLIHYYQTGKASDWTTFETDWTTIDEPVDFANGFFGVNRDPRGAKATAFSFVSIRSEKAAATIDKIVANLQYFEDHAPWDARFKRQHAAKPVVHVGETTIETGDFPVATLGASLPIDSEIQSKLEPKIFLFLADEPGMTAMSHFAGVPDFYLSPEDAARNRKYRENAETLMEVLRQVLGYSLGIKMTNKARADLKEQFSAMQEALADLIALWNAFDPKLKELGVVSDEIARTMYDSAALQTLLQLPSIAEGNTIENDRQRARQMVCQYLIQQTGAIALENRNGKTYVYVKDYEKMRQGVGSLLAELMRIRVDGDYQAIKNLTEKYAAHFDPNLRDQMAERLAKLGLLQRLYFAGINPDLSTQFDPAGNVTKVSITYPRNYIKQQLSYSAMQQP